MDVKGLSLLFLLKFISAELRITNLIIFNIVISYISEKYRLMAWRRFGLATINESGIAMDNKNASIIRENTKKSTAYSFKISFTFDTSSFISF